MQVVLGGKAHSQSREQTHHQVPGQKLEAVFAQPPETKTALAPKALLICETAQSVLGQQNPTLQRHRPALLPWTLQEASHTRLQLKPWPLGPHVELP